MKYCYCDQSCGAAVYHWHSSCRLVPEEPSEHSEWLTTNLPPNGRAKCNACIDIDHAAAPKPTGKTTRATTPSVPAAIRHHSSNA